MNIHQIMPGKRPVGHLFNHRSTILVTVLVAAAAIAIIAALSQGGSLAPPSRPHPTWASIWTFCHACADEALVLPELDVNTASGFMWPERLADMRSARSVRQVPPVHNRYRQPFNRIFADERLSMAPMEVSGDAAIEATPQSPAVRQVGPR